MKKSIALLLSFMVIACASNETKVPVVQTASIGERGFVNSKIESKQTEIAQFKKYLDVRKKQLADSRKDIASSSMSYRGKLAMINSKFYTSQNSNEKELMTDWKAAKDELDKIENNVFSLKELAASVQADKANTVYLKDSLSAVKKIKGVNKSDVSKINMMSEEVKMIDFNIDMFAKQAKQEGEMQQKFVNFEKRNLEQMALNIRRNMFNTDFSKQSPMVMGYGMNAMPAQSCPFATPASRPAANNTTVNLINPTNNVKAPIFTVKFKNSNIGYEEGLFMAINKSLKSDASRTLEVVSYGRDVKSAETYVKKVVKSLEKMGMPARRISLKSEISNVSYPTVKIFEK